MKGIGNIIGWILGQIQDIFEAINEFQATGFAFLVVAVAGVYATIVSILAVSQYMDGGLLEGIVFGSVVTVFQSFVLVLITTPEYLIGIWQTGTKSLGQFNQIQNSWVRGALVFVALAILAGIGGPFVIGAQMLNAKAVNAYLGIPDQGLDVLWGLLRLDMDSLHRSLILFGSEILVGWAHHLKIMAKIRQVKRRNLSAQFGLGGHTPAASSRPPRPTANAYSEPLDL